MKVSIITATYNSEKTIIDTLNCVSKQTYLNIEHLIIDGLSKDDTISIVNKYQHNKKIVIEKDKGIYDAMNKGIENSTGEIVGILNSDDFYSSHSVIQKIVDKFKETNCDALYGDLMYVDETDTNKIFRKWKSGSYKLNSFLYGWMPPHPTFFVRKDVYEKFGKFNLDLKSAADYEIMLRFLYKNKIKTSYLKEVLVHMRNGGQSNANLKNRIFANMEDRKAWTINGLKPYWFTLYLKPLRKVTQFFLNNFK
ncbi:MAG: glycosyltransferase family 2 protein [Chitinophagaceae bacterium]